ncbi:MAG TPA: ATP-binding cassette domain-containing protein [Kiloniellales bacterium]|nr:ATP-binding cassette domain-containing protein [Kiloniellales bacterium]
MEPNLFKYIWRHSKRDQLAILLLVAISLPFYFLMLDLPKQIVNQGILGQGFEGPGSTVAFMPVKIPYAEALFGHEIVLFDGLDLEQPNYLIALSLTFLFLVFVNGGFKFVINTSKGRLGERLLRRLRFELSDRVLRFSVPQVRKVKQAEVATMIKDEVDPLGGFIGDAFVTPAFLGGQALTAMTFIMVQSIWLGSIALAVVLFQAFLIPKLRVPILRLARQRVVAARELAGRIGEIVDGAIEIHAHDTSNFERADLSYRLGRIFDIRFEIFRRKFFVKFLNNFLAQLTPFVFYAGGGLLAIYGRLDVGALVAVINAYKDLPSPIKELIDWDQQRNDSQIKYEQVIEQFQPGELLDPAVQDPTQDPGPPFEGEIAASVLCLTDENGNRLVDSVSFTARADEHIAIVGDGGSGKDHLAMLLAALVRPTSGSIRIGNRDLPRLPEATTGRRLSFVGQDSYLFPHSLRENLIYGLKHRPVREREIADEELRAKRERWLEDARSSANSTLDIEADWIDYEAVGVAGPEELEQRMIEVLEVVGLEEDVYRFGLFGTLDPERHPEIAEAILEARRALPERLAAENAADLVVRFDPERYNTNASLAENLLFGTPRKLEYVAGSLARNPLVTEVLEELGLVGDIEQMGANIARTMVEIFADLPPGHPFFEQFSFIGADDLPEFRAIVGKLEKGGIESLQERERVSLRRLPYDYVEARHRLGLIGDELAERLVAARHRVAGRLMETDPDAVEFYRPDAYNAAATLQDNVLFGRIAFGQAQATEVVGRAMTAVLDTLGLRKIVIGTGLDYHVGVGGKRLSATQRQKVGLGRALLKRPDILIVADAVAVMDAATQRRLLEAILEQCRGRGLVWTLDKPTAADRFDRVMVMRDGRLVEQGSFEDLNKPGSALSNIMAAE